MERNSVCAVQRVLALLVLACVCVVDAAPVVKTASFEAAVDTIMRPFGSDAPGAAVIVVKDGRVALRKAYGLANLETHTPMRPEMVFEIGSVTKQFTSTAILMLAEHGKLALDDDIRRYVPEFPDKGSRITIEHLLTHTSGIKDYTDDPKWPTLWRQDLSPAQVLDLVKDAPLDFEPGTKWRYDNTGYTLLGMVLEKASGTPYAEFIRHNIFEPLGMDHSRYGSFSDIIPNRASGYTKGEHGWENAPYLSMAQPYAAGSLMSTVDDLALWDAAVSAGKLLSPASWQKAFADHQTPDGLRTRYGYGWQLGTYEGHAMIHHAGGIPGFVTQILRMPADHLYVAVLANADSPAVDPETAAVKIAAEFIGQPVHDPVEVKLSVDVLSSYTGVYQIKPGDTRTITREGTRLFSQRTGGPKSEVFAIQDGQLAFRDSFQRLSVERDASGRVVRMISESLDGLREVANKIQ